MPYRWVDHTAEVQLELEAESEEELLADAVAAFAELVDEPRGEPAAHAVKVEGSDRAALLVELLSELVYLVETEDFAPERIAELELRERSLTARVEGRRGNPSHVVKAVTWHGLRFERSGGGWLGTVVFDV